MKQQMPTHDKVGGCVDRWRQLWVTGKVSVNGVNQGRPLRGAGVEEEWDSDWL